ncbi:hypothetical protein B0T26DRAFT_815149 [Lasiosphaeria miniovina]|uniref:Uncharacterized protein n=1 Tax=Lasiosphaeria miniovina TaxID=1954250 RepID=A0AA40DMR2_9PEZI|nr:uncharacterized protein B0T26DRAFT_815149 [Lasiosphaeria miniovina]KAK0706911.1 hypothetical protein B0T26DRAFT_815149 [Lasiosphaeria miniovina]
MTMAAPNYHDSHVTNRWCLAGLVISWLIAIAASLASAILFKQEIQNGRATQILIWDTWREVLPLGLDVLVTLLNDSMGYIHTCTLRWSLQREGKLECNSNLPPSTFLALPSLTAQPRSIFLTLNPDLADLLKHNYDFTDAFDFHINAIALLAFGVGLLLQAIVTTWALAKTDVLTWSSNPLDPRSGRCMMSVHLAKEDARSLKPLAKQENMFKADRRVRRILYLLGCLPLVSVIWGGALLVYIREGFPKTVLGQSWSFLPSFQGITDSNCSAFRCSTGTSVVNLNLGADNGPAGMVPAVLLTTGVQSVVTISLHCAELIVNMSRDEKIYRALIGPKGTNGHYNSIVAALTAWQTVVLFLLKSGVHWLFGLAINLQFRIGINMYPPQVIYFAALTLATTIFGVFLSVFCRPKGSLPASYGHIQTIADIVDDWADSGCMFWGVKDHGKTGTDTRKVPLPDKRAWYGGLDYRDLRNPQQFRNTFLCFLMPSFPSSLYRQTQYPSRTQLARNYPSNNSLNSVFSAYSGYSEHTTQSIEPLLAGYSGQRAVSG